MYYFSFIIIAILIIIPRKQSAQYKLVYEGKINSNSVPLVIDVLWYPDSSWTVAYYDNDLKNNRIEKNGGKRIYVTKKSNVSLKNIYEIIKYPLDGIMYVMETPPWIIDNIYYSYDDYNIIKYDLIDSAKIIDSIECMLAKCTHRCRNYFLWYAENIPIPAGPWKFHGLPGLILEIQSYDGNIYYELKSIGYQPINFNDVFKRNHIPLNRLPHWSEQKVHYERFKDVIMRRTNNCEKCPTGNKSTVKLTLLECFD